ncbi:hypothetical protein KY284_011476 [Solanum tuberosum]|nr:hypothetical protein KY284_011476 [Solanum tuberosum]
MLFTANTTSRRVNVKYCKAPTVLRYKVSSWKGDPSKLESLEEDATYVCSHPFVLIISPK